MNQDRRQQAFDVRRSAAEQAKNRVHPDHVNNGEEFAYRRTVELKPGVKKSEVNVPTHIANFTKGLPHDEKTGLLLNPADYQQFVRGIHSADVFDFTETPLGPGELRRDPRCLSKEHITCDTPDRSKIWKSGVAQSLNGKDERPGADVRAWESAGAGSVFDLEGPDAQAVTMPPAPKFDSKELSAEIAEVYCQALLRDARFNEFPIPEIGRPATGDVKKALDMLRTLEWFNTKDCCKFSVEENSRRRNLCSDGNNLFRGFAPGDLRGPYLSQFLLVGNEALGGGPLARNGQIRYGAIRVDQKVRVAKEKLEFMTDWHSWLDVQNGANVSAAQVYGQNDPLYRFMTSPRDLATYVHVDALYEAYLNACLIMLAMEIPFDRGLPFQNVDVQDKQQGFVHFGGPHILSLVCEVATRGLKAVRYQKYNVHRRLRPEALGGAIDRYLQGYRNDAAFKPLDRLMEDFENLEWEQGTKFTRHICKFNQRNNGNAVDSYLLPMAFPEGSPMHPAYGAGHATVAGACVTILKAFFDAGHQLRFKIDDNTYVDAFESNTDGSALDPVKLPMPLTVEGELNKLAANISIGRNWAGVHYYTDYIESVRMGEKIAIGLLQEQKLTYPETFTMTVPLFDGGAIQI